MDTLIFANIFFIISSICILFVAAGFAILLMYIIPILKDIRYLFSLIKEEGEKVKNDIDSVRQMIKMGESKIMLFVSYLAHFFKKQPKSRKK